MQMTGIFRGVAYAAWMLAFGLSIWLAVEFHEYHIGIALGVAILALILSAFGLLMARSCGQQKDRLAMTIGIVLWAAGAISFAITELGFWSSSYKDRHAEYVQVKTAKARQEGMKDMAWDALRTGEMRASTAEIEARIKAARQSELYASSAGCTNATAKKSREFCGSYYELEAKLASAGKMETLEARLLGDRVDAKQTMVHNVFAAADLIAENSNFTEKQAATIVVLTIALVLMLARDLLLIVANPFGGAASAQVAPGRPEALPATDAAPRAFTPALPLSPRAELRPYSGAMAKLAGVANVNLPEIPDSSPDGPGTPAPTPEPEEPKIEEVAAVRSDKVISLFRDDGSLPDSPRSNKKAQKPEAKAAAWLAACTSQTGNPKHTVTSGECWKSYLAYCETEGKRPMHRKPFSSQVGVLVGRKTGKARKRDKNGSVFTGLMINPVMAVRRRVA
jgi:hypothetical protein